MPPSSDRESAGEGERRPRQHHQHQHQHSQSQDQTSRALVPMWDSSDPDRAPPPLPLNPQSPSFNSRAGTSTAIQSAHAAMNDRARESAALVPALAKRMADASPDKALVKGAASHRRMQSLQQGSVRDLSLMLEAARSSDKQDRPCTPTPLMDSASQASTPTLTPRRPAPQSILGHHTPPQSSTMLALQTMGVQQASPDAAGPAKAPHTIEGLSAQILSLTNIAQSLHKEMNQLSRRSKDNATDLLSLKEVTSSRDEDIRKSLRHLVGNMSDASSTLSSHEHYPGLYIDNKPHYSSPPPSAHPPQLARVPSIKSFTESIDRASISTPALSAAEHSASMALLEKILRTIGSHDGNESLVELLHHVSDKLSSMATAAKMDELAEHLRQQSESAIVSSSPVRGRHATTDKDASHLDIEYCNSGSVQRLLHNGELRRSSVPSARGSELLNEDLIKIIRSVKDSVAQGGGLTAEVKALVRELRGEVLGMGRELGKRLERMGARALDEAESPSKDDVSRVIDQGLEQMKEQLNHVLREHRRQSQASTSSQKTLVDYQEIYNAMRAALRDNEASRGDDMPDLSREDVIEAVREAWENYKPEIEVQQLGLERDEVLTCLKEGLRECLPADERPTGATREEVFKAVVEGLKHFVPPQMHTTASMSRDEIIEAVRDCLEEFEFPAAASAVGNDLTHMDMMHAVKQGLEQGLEGLHLSRSDDMMMAEPHNHEVLARLDQVTDLLKAEFQAVSEEAKENVAASGRDTEQVLDATKDGLENLRIAIESYVDSANGTAGQDELRESLTASMDELKAQVSQVALQANESARQQLQTELEELRHVVNSSMVPAAKPPEQDTNHQVLEALHNGLGGLRQEILRPRPETSEILGAIQDGLSDVRAGLDRVTNRPVDFSANDEILEALQSGLESIRADIETLRSNSETAVAAVARVGDDAAEQAIVPADMVRQDDIKKLEVLITQLRIKVEAMEEPERRGEGIERHDLDRFEDMLRHVQNEVSDFASRQAAAFEASSTARQEQQTRESSNGDGATREDVEAIETLMRNTKARLDDLMDGEQAVRKENIDVIETLVLETRQTMGAMASQLDDVAHKDDLAGLQGLLGQLIEEVEALKTHAEKEEENDDKATKTDIEAVETVVLEMKTAVDEFAALVSTKDQVAGLETLVREHVDKTQAHSEASAKAMDDRQAEIVGVADRVTEIKGLLQELDGAVKDRLAGIESWSKAVGETMDKKDQAEQDVKSMFEHVKTQFDETKEMVAGARVEAKDKVQETAELLGGKIEEHMRALLDRHDELRAAMEDRDTAAGETQEAVAGTKAVAEELKLLVDTLGSTVTDSLEKMEEASKIVFGKVEELGSRADETHAEAKTEHDETRKHVEQAARGVQELKDELGECQPKVLEAVKDLLLLVGEHFEHSKAAVMQQAALPPAQPYDDCHVQQKLDRLAEERYDDSGVRDKLDQLLGQQYDDSDVRQKLQELAEQRYDDSCVHDKLDKLVHHSTLAEQALGQLEALQHVHQTVVGTAADLSHLVSSQKQRIADEHDDREKTLLETRLALERKLEQKEHVEAAVRGLQDEQRRLHKSISSLRAEQESLVQQKTRLTGDVSSLETAMRLRREELADMECRADRLERRILEGVMDHSRVLLMAKNRKEGDKMSRKRANKTDEPRPQPPPSSSTALGAALCSKRTGQSGASRRIASLSQMNSNLPSGSVKRSNSVRTQLGGGDTFRKRSWGGGGLALKGGVDLDDKENTAVQETVEELDEETASMGLDDDGDGDRRGTGGAYRDDDDDDDDHHDDIHHDDDDKQDMHSNHSNGDAETDQAHSDAGTLRRSSMGTTVMTSTTVQYTESEAGYSDHDDYGESMLESDAGAANNDVVLYGQ
ncbi:hypothetical protein CDD82_2286 [Ophiocordyceps australis]|uniref:Uncharacterized protein n=1 Tax=Ophiocordyceps australis TaxID=1399860 RepID=A0A2C5XV96_9HYPO|nr:hypothetical protein CDD82_2286 [Ophiocordyceps australis]